MRIYKNGELIRSMSEDSIFAMANLRGCKVSVPHKLPFSFYFSQCEASHTIRVKVQFNPEKLSINKLGVLELHGDYKFTPGSDDKSVSSKQINDMRDFFKEYKVLFAAVWDGVLPEDTVQDYFRGIESFNDLKSEFDFSNDFTNELAEIHSFSELEQLVRDNNLFNMYD